MDLALKKVEKTLSVLKSRIVAHSIPITDFYYRECDIRPTGDVLPNVDDSFTIFREGCTWASKPDTHAWFIKDVDIEITESQLLKPYLTVETDRDGWNVYNPQFMAYINGSQIQSFDTNHRSAALSPCKGFALKVYAYSGSMGKDLPFNCRIEYINAPVEKLYYDMLVPFEMLSVADTEGYEYAAIRRILLSACDALDLREGCDEAFMRSVAAAEAELEKLSDLPHKGEGHVVCIGHSHIDVAWMWTLAQTREKICRTVSTVLALMDKYPEFIFMESQAQLYKFLKEESPELYEKVKQRVREGRWEVEGAMWVEADCNLTSGESLVRQIIHGKRFFKSEFGIDSRILWLPDVFGYSASLPQICKKSGIDVFLTSKISWNDTNRMPFDAFRWRGIDGSEIFTYFLTAQEYDRDKGSARYTTYVAETSPKFITGAAKRMTKKDISENTLLTYGWGDGGGGPTKKMLEILRRIKKHPLVCPSVGHAKAGDFLREEKKKYMSDPTTPVWQGELYLEYHRGTYTSVSEVKRNNRKAEFALNFSELISSIGEALCSVEYPADKLYGLYETLLTNQFHDILPGSSIPEVYKVSAKQFDELFGTSDDINANAVINLCRNLSSDGGLLVFNPHSFAASSDIRIDGKTMYVRDIPAKGYKVVKPTYEMPITVSGNGKIENNFYRLEFDRDFNITRIYDKSAKREVISGLGNRLVAYEDRPFNYSCWNIEEYHKDKPYPVAGLVKAEHLSEGQRSGYKITRKFMSSTVVQYIWMYDHSRRIDFVTDVDWAEKDLLLKAEFDVNVRSENAVYDIQYGAVSRPTHSNTSWDKAKFEVCGQKFADLSDHGYGVALLNDCKYGYDIHGSTMALSLIKCSDYVNEYYDIMHHTFTYSLLPHVGDYREAGVIKEAYLLNSPLLSLPVSAHKGSCPDSFSFVSCDKENVFVECVKKAYDGRGYIIRAYEAFDMHSDITFTIFKNLTKVYECDLLENDISSCEKHGNTFEAHFAPREIKTFRIIV